MKSISSAAIVGLAFLAAAPATAQVRQAPVAPFTQVIACEWKILSGGWMYAGTGLYARNTLNHELPVGTRLTWTYLREDRSEPDSGAFDLTAALPPGRVTDTGGGFYKSNVMAKSCRMVATYPASR